MQYVSTPRPRATVFNKEQLWHRSLLDDLPSLGILTPEEKKEAIRQQFEKSVIKQTGCWGWRKKPLKTGYGALYIGKRKLASAHRISWIIHRGEIPDKLFVLHKCDNRICTNPDHLFLGTHIDNMRDMVSKNRQYKKRL
jgi:HNH endonuclease